MKPRGTPSPPRVVTTTTPAANRAIAARKSSELARRTVCVASVMACHHLSRENSVRFRGPDAQGAVSPLCAGRSGVRGAGTNVPSIRPGFRCRAAGRRFPFGFPVRTAARSGRWGHDMNSVFRAAGGQ
ncbi:hypothetical protein GCM10011578_096480 [Streptomyces fuscichromogenes]|uniref:Uncharacterized protein n=1 Tax=Streptomyces fuscichromogenes TaxID=1324013 RepID=A0A917XNV9_9ACTN|nr:hypothetical protein GCM10011578_096480 [Streptomyces fuscichromogenes]